jgi:hypothetical protein
MSRWSVCPGSVSLLEKYPTPTNHHAQEGTLAHDWAERKLLALMAGGEGEVMCADADMDMYTENYAKYCMELYEKCQSFGSSVEGEFSLDIEAEHDEVFGTNDFCCWNKEILHIVDFKYGKHKVKAKDNKQLMYYALGAIKEHKLEPTLIYLHIYQPRAGKRSPYNYHEISIGELLNFEAELKVAIKRVDEQPDEYVTGSHCFFCNRSMCPEQTRIAHKGSPTVEDTVHFKGNKSCR